MTDNSRVRVSIVGVVIVALFIALLARLWFLQMGAEEELRFQAVARSTRMVQTESPRGRILDRNGTVLVENVAEWAVTIDRQLDDDDHERVIGQLAEVLAPQYTAEQLEQNFTDVRQTPLKPAIVAVGVPEQARIAILEHIEDYPGTKVQKLTVRHYPQGKLAAHVLGYVGEISDEQLASRRDAGYQEGETIGKDGAERAFEKQLRGTPRRERVEVDPTGQPVGAPLSVEPGTIGNDVTLTIDASWQAAAELALAQGIASARTQKNENIKDKRFETLKAPGGAVVAMDITDGSIVAMASFPDYDPSQFVDGISQAEWSGLNDNPDHPLVNRATQGQYAPGSTFKLVTSIAMTKWGIRSADEWITDRGSVKLGKDERQYNNAGQASLGRLKLQGAITRSSDVYFYTAGDEFWQAWNNGDTERGLGLQTTAREWGFGASTGIELDEARGSVPDPEWKKEIANATWPTEDQRRENGQWYPADDILMAVGQGGMAVTPLQLANGYAAFANGGTLWKPHIAKAVNAPSTDPAVPPATVSAYSPEAIRQVEVDPYVRAQMLAGFEGVTSDEKGTAFAPFQGFPLDIIPVAGKTGTAQVGARSEGRGDTSLFAAYFPANAPKYVVVVVVEEAGRGAQTAAPIARRVIEAINGLTPTGPVEALRTARD
jgi:penicillin-binding protein 2